jgi:hypothetical protein
MKVLTQIQSRSIIINQLISKNEIGRKILIKDPTKATKRIEIKSDRKNSRRMQFNEKKNPNKININ